MAVQKTSISWTDSTWNPTTGCTKISAGCEHCYAETLTNRFGRQRFDDIKLHESRLAAVARFKPISKDGRLLPRMVFVNSMSDLHHEQIPDAFIHRVYDAMEANSGAIFQVLTKRPGPMRRFLRARYRNGRTPRNLWLGVSVEDSRVRKRIDVLRDIVERHAPACAFLSVEPLIGAIDACNFAGMDWVLIGGESGPHCRPMQLDWLQCAIGKARAAGAAIWFKQYGHPRNNPAVTRAMREKGLGVAAAFAFCIEQRLELAPQEKGGATIDGRLIRELPGAWHEAAATINVAATESIGNRRFASILPSNREKP